MKPQNQSKKESDLAERIGELQEKRESIEKDILALKNQGEIAPRWSVDSSLSSERTRGNLLVL